MSQDRPPFASSVLDRDAETRMGAEKLRTAWRESTARVMRLRGPEVLVDTAADGRTDLVLTPTHGEDLPEAGPGQPGACYLGRLHGSPVFALAADGSCDEAAPEQQWRHVFEIAASLTLAEQELVAVASALLRWHENAAFSPRDGGTTSVAHGGWARLDSHGGEHFPRTDPAVIVLVEHDDRVLLGSNVLWPSGRFSLLAGFVEAGESLEQTVEREVYEEAGVKLSDVRYVASQPWPFPRSLMLGFRAELSKDQDPLGLRPDTSEISELRWFTRDELRNPGPGITLPGGTSIARWLLDRWIDEDGGRREDGGGRDDGHRGSRGDRRRALDERR